MDNQSIENKKEQALLSIIVPAYNEEKTIVELVESLKALDLPKEIIIVNDCSTDKTQEKLLIYKNDPDIKFINHDKNMGKGAAVRTGLNYANSEITVIQDADLEYDPKEIPELITPIIEKKADVVYGSRLSGGKPQRVYMFWHLVGNRLLSLLTNILYNSTLTDMETGYKAFRTEIIKNIKLRSNSFTIEPEITAKVLKRKLRVYEMPISYYGRTYEEGKKITWRHAFPAIIAIFRYRFMD